MMSPVRFLFIPGILIFLNIRYSHQQVFQVTLENTTVAPGGYVTLDVQVVAGITGSGVWFKNGNPLSNIPGKLMMTERGQYRQLFLFNAGASDVGSYTFTINGQSTSAYLTVGVSGPVDGDWGEWIQWIDPSCPATCGPTASRNVTRSRTCTNPAPSNGGTTCPGDNSQRQTEQCGPATCGSSVISRPLQNATRRVGEQLLFQIQLTQTGLTGVWQKNEGAIPTDSRILSGNTGSIFLYINSLQVSDSGKYTFTVGGETTTAFVTVTSDTAVNGNWGKWSQWSGPSCPATCGPTARRNVTRSRTCFNPAPSNGGASCPGDNSERQTEQCASSSCVTSTFTNTLSDETRSVGGQVVFQVNLAQSGVTGVWTKDGVTITADGTHQIVSNSLSAILYIANLQVSNSGRYCFTANGETISAQLTVYAYAYAYA